MITFLGNTVVWEEGGRVPTEDKKHFGPGKINFGDHENFFIHSILSLVGFDRWVGGWPISKCQLFPVGMDTSIIWCGDTETDTFLPWSWYELAEYTIFSVFPSLYPVQWITGYNSVCINHLLCSVWVLPNARIECSNQIRSSSWLLSNCIPSTTTLFKTTTSNWIFKKIILPNIRSSRHTSSSCPDVMPSKTI